MSNGGLEARFDDLEERVRQLEIKEAAAREQLRDALRRIEAMGSNMAHMAQQLDNVAQMLTEQKVTSTHTQAQMRWIIGAAWTSATFIVGWVVIQSLTRLF